ncbi:M48 family metalloprotease [Oryzihumus leptocrescens]|uniref:Peptidase M48-like protein n=1 Tax=Oryzihumus leptocrescens TaxID=297536 RepID=A0A542ZF08_9MICO|nr:M48 family metalloprotease [Oryzihumus leptocrescens]TQL58936.1 peptidase M48-like protein [Oryzihumus leptocrescens]
MRAALLVPLLASLALRVAAPWVSRRLPPPTAATLLAVTALLTALSLGFTLSVAGLLTVARIPIVAAAAQWSIGVVASGDPVPVGVGLLSGAVVIVLVYAAARSALHHCRDLVAAATTCRRLHGSASGLVVREDDVADAYALPGFTGRIVVSTGMLRALPAPERKVLLAHEEAHLRHHHHLYVAAANLAAAANPLLRPVSGAVAFSVERWADEAAASEVDDRRLAARALARAGLARLNSLTRARETGSALAAVDSSIGERTRALLAPPRPASRRVVAVILLLAMASVGASALVAHDTEHRFELAHIRTSTE